MLPVAGVTADIADDILTGLRAAAAAQEEELNNGDVRHRRRRPPSSTPTAAAPSLEIPERWLDALLLAQISADALHRDAERARRALSFWRRAAAEGSGVVGGGGSSSWGRGSHSARLLLRSGPREALRGLGKGASCVAGRVSSLLFASGKKEEEEEAGGRSSAGEGEDGGEGEEGEEDNGDDDDPAAEVDAKVRELALLSSELERALCRVHRAAAGLLTMGEKKKETKGGRGRGSSSSPLAPSAVLAAADAAAAACCRALCGALAAARAAPLRAAGPGGADTAALCRGTRGGMRLSLGLGGGAGSGNGDGGGRPSSAAAAAARSAAARPASAPLPPASSPLSSPAPPPAPSSSSSSSSEAAIEAAEEALGLSPQGGLPPRFAAAPGGGRPRRRAPEALAAVTFPVVVCAGASPAAAAALPVPRGGCGGLQVPLISIAPLPERLRPPSWLQQRWLLVGGLAVGGLAAACLLARRCRLLGGDGSLERAVSGTLESAAGALDAHVVEPLASLRAEMFSTLRDRRAIVTNEEFLSETQALERMLADFDRDVSSSTSSSGSKNSTTTSSSSSPSSPAPSPKPSSPSPSPSPPPPPSMAKLMRTYEDELRNPVKNLISGQLARCLLIQLQKVKVDSASALLEMDQVLRANELSLAATAAVPALAAVYLAVVAARRLFFSNRGPPPDPRRAAAPLRSAFADAEDALFLLAAAAAEEEGAEEDEEREALEGRALFELGRALAAVDALLGLGGPRSPPPPLFFLAGLSSAVLRLLPARPARAFGELESASSSGSSSAAASSSSVGDALPLVVGGVLGSGSWRAGDAARCRAGLVALASPSLFASAAARAEAAGRLARASALLKQ